MRPPTVRRLSLSERALLRAYRFVSRNAFGYEEPLFSLSIQKNGLRVAIKHVPRIFNLHKALAARFGEIEWQFLMAMTALWVGCRWCFVGHVYSASLIVFRDEGVLSPLDEHDVVKYELMPDERFLEELRTMFAGPRWERMLYLIDRHYALRTESIQPENEDDELLSELLDAWDWVTECSIELLDTDPTDIPAVSGGYNMDKKLVARYEAARAQARREAREGGDGAPGKS